MDLWESPLVLATRREMDINRSSQLELLGANLAELFGCDHPHLMFLAPYEEFERYMFPDKLAERLSEFKLYLANYADSAGIPAAALEEIAEPLARQLLGRASMSDTRDWFAVPEAMSAIDTALVEAVMGKS